MDIKLIKQILTTAYLRGQRDYELGQLYTQNPYTITEEGYFSWQRGWLNALRNNAPYNLKAIFGVKN